jgi:hypothetical protein
MKKWLFLILSFSIISYSSLLADGKKFVRSYTAYTLPANELELEFLYLNRFDKMIGSFSNYKPRLEIEYGIINRLTASFYFNFEGTNADNNTFSTEPFTLESNSLELRYALSQPGNWIADPALYFEFEYGKDVIGYEPRIILSEQYNDITGVLNVKSEFEKERDTGERTTNFEITGGAVYQFNKMFGAGFEFRHSRIYGNTFEDQLAVATFIGPNINIATEEFNLSINLMRQIGGSPVTGSGLELMRNVKYEFGAILELEL